MLQLCLCLTDSSLGYTLIADPGGRCNLLVATCNLLVGICNMLVDMLYNVLFNKHTFREHKRDNDRYFAVLTMVNMIMRCNGGKY